MNSLSVLALAALLAVCAAGGDPPAPPTHTPWPFTIVDEPGRDYGQYYPATKVLDSETCTDLDDAYRTSNDARANLVHFWVPGNNNAMTIKLGDAPTEPAVPQGKYWCSHQIIFRNGQCGLYDYCGVKEINVQIRDTEGGCFRTVKRVTLTDQRGRTCPERTYDKVDIKGLAQYDYGNKFTSTRYPDHIDLSLVPGREIRLQVKSLYASYAALEYVSVVANWCTNPETGLGSTGTSTDPQ